MAQLIENLSDVTVCLPTLGGDDLPVALAALDAYLPDEVYLLCSAPDEPTNSPLERLERLVLHHGWPPDECVIEQVNATRTGGEAWDQLIRTATTPWVILTADDVVITPGTVETMVREANELHAHGRRVGMIGARSNYVKGRQNIRFRYLDELDLIAPMRLPNEDHTSLLPAGETCVPICALVNRQAALEVGGMPHGNWFSDDLFSWRLRRARWDLFVSTAYVHHLGERATGEREHDRLLNEGLHWLAKTDSRFFREVVGKYPGEFDIDKEVPLP